MTRSATVLLATLVALACLAAFAGPANGQERVEPPLYMPGDITAAGMGLDPTTGEVSVGFEINKVLESRRFAADGTRMGGWRMPIQTRVSTLAINGRTRELYEASTVRGAINITRWHEDGHKLETWDTGFTGFATDIDVDPWGGELLVGHFQGERLDLITLSRDGALLATWDSGYVDPAACVTLTTDRRYYVGLEGDEEAVGRVARYDDLGDRTAEWPVDERPVALALGPDDVLYVATRTELSHRGSVLLISDLGTVMESWPLGARPVDIDVDENGVVQVLLLRSYGRALEVVVLGPDGALLRSWMALMSLLIPSVG